ncbi:MAG: hypothetical protein FJ191_01430 [Gammaproteobacteria bacterium]|nr:hypothetical protein [Gammaproteobacteria bacterium]
MTRKIISWVLVGIFAYAWWWIGHRWTYINSPGSQWSSVYVLFTLISLAILLRAAKVTKSGLFDGFIATLRGFAPSLPWLVLAIVVARAVAAVHTGFAWMTAEHFLQAIVAVLAAAVTTALWYGAIENGSD